MVSPAFILKWTSVFVIFVTTIIGSFLPLCFKSQAWESCLEALAGGVFLGAGIAHLLDDSFNYVAEIRPPIYYPLASAVCLATFVLFTGIEFYSSHKKEAESDGSEGTMSVAAGTDQTESPLNPDDYQKRMFGSSLKHLKVATISLYIIMDIHSIIEGLALGILTHLSGVIAIFCAIVGHKPVEAFALSMIIIKDRPTKWFFWLSVIVYTLMSPIGIIAGIYISNTHNPLILGLIAAFSAGTFLFVGCHEWAEMFQHRDDWSFADKNWHFGSFFIGVLWMLLIAIVEVSNGGKPQ